VGGYSLTMGESRIQLSIWTIVNAPLILGADIRRVPEEARQLMKNPYLSEIYRHDSLGYIGQRVSYNKANGVEIWTRPLKLTKHNHANETATVKALAVAIVRRADNVQPLWSVAISVDFEDIGWLHKQAQVVNVFEKTYLGLKSRRVQVDVTPFDAVLLVLSIEEILS